MTADVKEFFGSAKVIGFSATNELPTLIDKVHIVQDAPKGAQEIIDLLRERQLNGIFLLPYGTENAHYLSQREAIYRIGSYAGLKGYSQKTDDLGHPIVYALGENGNNRGVFVLFAEMGINMQPFDGFKTFYRFDPPEVLESMLKYGYYQVPLRSCLFDRLPYKNGWEADRLGVALRLTSKEVNKGPFSYSLSLPKSTTDIRLPEEVRRLLGPLTFPSQGDYGTGEKDTLITQMRTQILLGGELLGVLQHVTPDRLDIEETRRINDDPQKREQLDSIL